MLIKISWRNIWRNPYRSLTIIAAITAGLVGGNLISAISTGMLNQSFEESINHRISHIQIHHPDFVANPEIRYAMENPGQIVAQLESIDQIKAVAPRLALDGMIASASHSAGIHIKGIDPDKESSLTQLESKLIAGSFFAEEARLPSLIIGHELAKKTKAQPGSRLVLTFQDSRGELISASFRVEGIYEISARSWEERVVYVRKDQLHALLGQGEPVTEIALLLNEHDHYPAMTEKIKEMFSMLSVRNWESIEPGLFVQVQMVGQSLIYVIAIILMGVAFGVLNTILMSVFERTRELGMLMAIGMKKARVFSMVLLETTMLSITGGVIGLLVSSALIRTLNHTGIQLGGEGLREMGFSSHIYPELGIEFYFQVAILVIIFALLAAIYPARKAVRLVPAEAVRKE